MRDMRNEMPGITKIFQKKNLSGGIYESKNNSENDLSDTPHHFGFIER
jgi:hypothetical protein